MTERGHLRDRWRIPLTDPMETDGGTGSRDDAVAGICGDDDEPLVGSVATGCFLNCC